jgi:hypothetical protein
MCEIRTTDFETYPALLATALRGVQQTMDSLQRNHSVEVGTTWDTESHRCPGVGKGTRSDERSVVLGGRSFPGKDKMHKHVPIIHNAGVNAPEECRVRFDWGTE